MNDDLLKKRLAGLKVPAPDETARERALHRALVALKNAPVELPRTSRPFLWRWAAVAGACAAVAILAVWQAGRPVGDELAAWQRTLREVEMLFPGQVNAVIERDGAVDLELSEGTSGGTSQPVVVEFVRGASVLRVLSYSGRKVCVDLGEDRACFEPLITAEGRVILSGEDFLWTADHPVSRGGYRVEARFLHPAS
jgi:hypothetical protein